METHKVLYKQNLSVLSPHNHSSTNRRIAQNERTRRREQNFQSNRRISPVSPTPVKQIKQPSTYPVTSTPGIVKPVTSPVCKASGAEHENTENAPLNFVNTVIGIPKDVCIVKFNPKLNRREVYLKRFIGWKEAKKKEAEANLQAKRGAPPMPAWKPSTINPSGNMTAANTAQDIRSLAPKNDKFKAPIESNIFRIEKLMSLIPVIKPLRKSLYATIPTPKKEQEKFHIERKATAKLHTPRPLWINGGNVLATAAGSDRPRGSACKPPAAFQNAAQPTKSTQRGVNGVAANAMPFKSQGLFSNRVAKTTATATAVKSLNKPPSNVPTAGAAVKSLNKPPSNVPTAAAAKSQNKLSTVAPTTTKTLLKPRQLILPPPLPPSATVRKVNDIKPQSRVSAATGATAFAKPKYGGAISKVKQLQTKEAVTANAHKNAKLTTSMKAKKPIGAAGVRGKIDAVSSRIPTIKTNVVKRPAATIVGQTKIKTNLLLKQNRPTDISLATPTEAIHMGFDEFITSTKMKKSIEQNFNDKISPIEKCGNCPSAAKRTLLDLQENSKEKPSNTAQFNKFQFVRYAEMSSTDADSPTLVDFPKLQNIRHNSQKKVEDQTGSTLINQSDHMEGTNNTQTNSFILAKDNDRPINYLSPFVSVSRGKVNSRTESERRNSVYLQTEVPITQTATIHLTTVPPWVSQQSEASVKIRRTLEMVRYFRKQLSNEISRLHEICDKWELYKQKHLATLQIMGGDDMINAATGQTKLLTSKKFMQFLSLIDRCEAGATGIGAVTDDGSEDTKPVNCEDLQGWWDMITLQCDNVDKRFMNLERWKSNNWLDPDDEIINGVEHAKPKKKNPIKMKKTKPTAAGCGAGDVGVVTKAKASSSLKQMMRKMHAEMRKNQAATAAVTTENSSQATKDIIYTPKQSLLRRRSRSSQGGAGSGTPHRNSTPRHLSVIVRDRKSLSLAATIVSIPTPKSRRTLAMGGVKNSPSQNMAQNKHLLRSVLRSSGVENQISQPGRKPPPLSTPPSVKKSACITPKSILKTPGTASKGIRKSVLFDEKKYVRKFKFTVEDETTSDDSDKSVDQATDADNEQSDGKHEERTYGLRSRKVKLRPSSEIVIPNGV